MSQRHGRYVSRTATGSNPSIWCRNVESLASIWWFVKTPPFRRLQGWWTHCGLVVSAPAWDGTGCEFDSWQCLIYIPCSLSLRLLGFLRGSLGTYGLTQKLCLKKTYRLSLPTDVMTCSSTSVVCPRKLLSGEPCKCSPTSSMVTVQLRNGSALGVAPDGRSCSRLKRISEPPSMSPTPQPRTGETGDRYDPLLVLHTSERVSVRRLTSYISYMWRSSGYSPPLLTYKSVYTSMCCLFRQQIRYLFSEQIPIFVYFQNKFPICLAITYSIFDVYFQKKFLIWWFQNKSPLLLLLDRRNITCIDISNKFDYSVSLKGRQNSGSEYHICVIILLHISWDDCLWMAYYVTGWNYDFPPTILNFHV